MGALKAESLRDWLPIAVVVGGWILTVGIAANRLERLDTDLKEVRAALHDTRAELSTVEAQLAVATSANAVLTERVNRIVTYVLPKE